MIMRYETLMLMVPEATNDELAHLEAQLDKTVADAKAQLLSFERWGKYRLAYPVRKNDYGIYFLMRFEGEKPACNQVIDEFKSLFGMKYIDLVMRHLLRCLDPKGSLEYQRPESLEEAPTRDVDSFLRRNKMRGLIDKGHPSKGMLAADALNSLGGSAAKANATAPKPAEPKTKAAPQPQPEPEQNAPVKSTEPVKGD